MDNKPATGRKCKQACVLVTCCAVALLVALGVIDSSSVARRLSFAAGDAGVLKRDALASLGFVGGDFRVDHNWTAALPLADLQDSRLTSPEPAGACSVLEAARLLFDGLAVRDASQSKQSLRTHSQRGPRTGGPSSFRRYSYRLGEYDLAYSTGSGCMSNFNFYLHPSGHAAEEVAQEMNGSYIILRLDGGVVVNRSFDAFRLGRVPDFNGSLSVTQLDGGFVSYKQYCWSSEFRATMYNSQLQAPFDFSCYYKDHSTCPLYLKLYWAFDINKATPPRPMVDGPLHRLADKFDNAPAWPSAFFGPDGDAFFPRTKPLACSHESPAFAQQRVQLRPGQRQQVFNHSGEGVIWALGFDVAGLATVSALFLTVQVDGRTTFERIPFDMLFGGNAVRKAKIKTYRPIAPSTPGPYAAACSASWCHFGLPMAYYNSITITVEADQAAKDPEIEFGVAVDYGALPPGRRPAHLYAYHSTTYAEPHGDLCSRRKHTVLDVRENRWGTYVGLSFQVKMAPGMVKKEGDHILNWDETPGGTVKASGVEDLFSQYWNFHAPGMDPLKRETPFYGTYWQESTVNVHAYRHYLTDPFPFEANFSHHWLTTEDEIPTQKSCFEKAKSAACKFPNCRVESVAFYYMGTSPGWELTSKVEMQDLVRHTGEFTVFRFQGYYANTDEYERVGVDLDMLEAGHHSTHAFNASVRADHVGMVIRCMYDRSAPLRHISTTVDQWPLQQVLVRVNGESFGTWSTEEVPHAYEKFAVADFRLPAVPCGRAGDQGSSTCHVSVLLQTTGSSIWTVARYELYSLLPA